MFTVYKSNNINILLSKVYQIIQEQPLSNIFEQEIFIHDNKVLFQYLNIFIAEKIGISANFKLYHPHDFIWKLFQKILFKKNLKNMFTQSIIAWKIMKIIDENNFFEFFNKNEKDVNKLKFSFSMAKIFEQYLFYRPNWIYFWEKGKNILKINNSETWQIKLWMKIIDYTKKNNQSTYHFSKLFYIFKSLINEKKIKKQFFPNRFFIISSFSLNPSYIKIFKKISSYTHIYFLHITPYKNKIFNLINNNRIASEEIIDKNNTLNNSLIILWGQYEKIYELHIINSKKTKIKNCFQENKNCNLLNSIKNDFLNFNPLKIDIIKKRYLQLTDNSISINICYNKKNEIEILYKTLSVFFYENSNIKPGDIVVTSFSIDTYILYINEIFTSVENTKQIPYFISQKFSKKTEIILSSFNKILNLSNSRFENEEILELLDIPEIAKKFNISEEEINILYHWIEETNIRWAIDSKHKDSFLFPKNNQNTWLYGIEKLLLSYAMNNTESIWNNILSCSFVNGSRAELLGKLIIFIKILEKWQKKLSKPQCLKYWRSLSNDLINDFFYNSEEIEKSIQIIQKNWIEMIDDSLSSNYLNKISINILRKNFFYKNNFTKNRKFLPGVVNFCHPASICYIPFKIICVIGVDHKNVPKKKYFDNFNLLNKYSLIDDVDIYQRYCYLFLQNISCAKKIFYISYVGYSVQNNQKIHPSILVDQLINYIALNFCFVGNRNLSLENNKKTIIKHLCQKYKQKDFYEKKNIDNSTIKIFQNTYKKIYTEIYKKDFHEKILLKKNNINKINLTTLIKFWKNPIQYFFNFTLNIKFNLNKKEFNTTEPFLVNTQDSFKIKNILLNKIINNQDTKELFQYYILSGKLPYNFFGKIFWNKTIKEMEYIAKSVIKYKISTKEKKINLKIQKYHIHGVLSEIQSTGLLRWKPSIINYSDRISLWLEHLVYCIIGGYGESKIIGSKSQVWSFSYLNPETAYNYLLKYIKGYMKGIKKPLLLTKSGASWLDQVYDIKNNFIKTDDDAQEKGNKKLLENWMGNNYIKGEKKDFYIQQIITNLNKKNMKKICETAQKWLVPILKNKK